MTLTLDYSLMLAPAVPGALDRDAFVGLQRRFESALAALRAREANGELGFLALPSDAELLRSSTGLAAELHGSFDDVVVLGIGGSALGTIAMRSALLGAGWNQLPIERRGGRPRLHVVDNVDPATLIALLQLLRLDRTLFVVASKSGSTAETMAQYLCVRDSIERSSLQPRKHFVFVTDAQKGALRAIANQEGVPALTVPANVGGRFSVLSPVGIFPAQLCGIDAAEVLAGASAMARRCMNPDMLRNPAGCLAILQWQAHTTAGCGTHVLMPYVDGLREYAQWFVQLWAESLGKIDEHGVHVGPTPLAALGATDQHSQVQLFMQGPRDKTVTFVVLRKRAADIAIPAGRAPGELSYLGGHTLGELLDSEQRATAAALAANGRPSMALVLDQLDAAAVGELFMLMQVATVLAGDLYGVNPLDQPGVELGKEFTYALMGRPGTQLALERYRALPQGNPHNSV